MNRFLQSRERQCTLMMGEASPVYAFIASTAEAASRGAAPILTVACRDSEYAMDWISWRSRGLVAAYIAAEWARENNDASEDNRTARMAAEIAVGWRMAGDCGLTVEAARHRVARICVQHLTASAQDLTSAIRTLWAAVGREASLAGEQVTSYSVPGHPNGVAISKQKDVFFSRYGPAVPSVVLPQAMRAPWVSMCAALDDPDVFIPAPAASMGALDGALNQTLLGMSDQAVMSLMEFIAANQEDISNCNILGSVFITVAAYCKGTNVTTNWVDRRADLFQRHLGVQGITNIVSSAAVEAFARLYPRESMDTDRFINMLSSIYTVLKSQSIDPLAWIIEQATHANVTPVKALATVVATTPGLGLQVVVGHEVFRSQLATLAQLCGTLLHDPMGSVIRPPIPQQRYADWAQLGVTLRKMAEERSAQRDRIFGRVASSAAQYASLSLEITRNLATSMLDKAMYKTELGADLRVEAGKLFGGVAVQHGANFYITPRPGASFRTPLFAEGVSDDSHDVDDGVTTIAGGHDAGAAGAEERASWPASVQTLPGRAFRMTAADLLDYTEANQSPQAAALARVLGAVHNAGAQQALSMVTRVDGHYTMPSRYKAVQQELLDELRVLGVGDDLLAVWENAQPGGSRHEDTLHPIFGRFIVRVFAGNQPNPNLVADSYFIDSNGDPLVVGEAPADGGVGGGVNAVGVPPGHDDGVDDDAGGEGNEGDE